MLYRTTERSVRAVVGALALTQVLVSRVARAETANDLDLKWNAVPGCPNAANVRARIEKLAPRARSRGALLRAEARIRVRANGYSLSLVLQDGASVGRRTFIGNTCEEVTGAASVTIALLLRPPEDTSGTHADSAHPNAALVEERTGASRTDGASDAETKRTPGSQSKRDGKRDTKRDATRAATGDTTRHPRPDRERDRSEADSATPQDSNHWLLELPRLGVGLGLLSQPLPGLGGGVGFEWQRWRFGVSGLWSWDTQVAGSGTTDARVALSHQALGVEGCRWLLPEPVQIALCVTLSVEHLLAQGTGTGVTATRAEATWLALGPALLGRWVLGSHAAVSARVAAELQTSRPVLVITRLGTVEQVGPLQLTSSLGVEWIF